MVEVVAEVLVELKAGLVGGNRWVMGWEGNWVEG